MIKSGLRPTAQLRIATVLLRKTDRWDAPFAVFSKEQIYNSVWKEPYFGDYNIVMSHIRNIREKIEDNPSKPIYIQTVWGVGYRFNKNML